jgi:hypothetical protein
MMAGPTRQERGTFGASRAVVSGAASHWTEGNEHMKLMRLVALIVVVAIFVPAASATDWDSCADDLDRLRRAARDAADKANDVKSKSEEVKSTLDDFENCKRYPETYDLLRDGCRSKASDYRSALSDYQSAVSDLQSELETVKRRMRSVDSSCEYPLGSTDSLLHLDASGSENQYCALYRRYKSKLPLATLMKNCTQSMSEAECKKCLADK